MWKSTGRNAQSGRHGFAFCRGGNPGATLHTSIVAGSCACTEEATRRRTEKAARNDGDPNPDSQPWLQIEMMADNTNYVTQTAQAVKIAFGEILSNVVDDGFASRGPFLDAIDELHAANHLRQ